jgi:Transposase, Mutator family
MRSTGPAAPWSFNRLPTRSGSVNARIRRAVKARGHFPNEAAALKCVYLAIMGLDPTGQGRRRWMIRWNPALNAFDMTFDGRLAARPSPCGVPEVGLSL